MAKVISFNPNKPKSGEIEVWIRDLQKMNTDEEFEETIMTHVPAAGDFLMDSDNGVNRKVESRQWGKKDGRWVVILNIK